MTFLTTLDRMFLVSFFRSYAIVWTSLISLYVVIDLFTNIDSFGKAGSGVVGVATHIASYYGYQVTLIFDLMAEAITLLAAMFSVSWMQRNNELLPQLSAGIPTRRVLRPIVLGAAVTLSFAPLNRELIIPRIAAKLAIAKDDPDGSKAQVVMGAYDPTGIHVEGMAGFRKELRVLKFYVTFPESSPSGMVHMLAEVAIYVPPGDDPDSGGWRLKQTTPEIFDLPPERMPTNLRMIQPGEFFLRTAEVDYETVSRGATWYLYASTPKLRELLDRPDTRKQARVAVLFHMRLVRPVWGALMTLLGVAVILWNPNRHVFISAGMCLVVCVAFYATILGSKYLGDNGHVAPPLAAWLPVLIFGPATLVAFDSIHT